MSAQAAGKAVAQGAKAAAKAADSGVVNKGAKRDPELYVSEPYFICHAAMCFILEILLTGLATNLRCSQILMGVMTGAIGLAGYYFGETTSFDHC